MSDAEDFAPSKQRAVREVLEFMPFLTPREAEVVVDEMLAAIERDIREGNRAMDS